MEKQPVTIKYSVTYKGKGGSTTSLSPEKFDDLEYFYDFAKGALINIALDALKEEQTKGFDKEPVVVVDNKRGKAVKDVKPLGKIQFISRQDLKDVLKYTYEKILERQPNPLSGRYSRSHIVTYNGRQVASDLLTFNRWLDSVGAFSPQDKVRFINTAPYARKLERYGISKGRNRTKSREAKRHEKRAGGTRYLVPNGTYKLAYVAVSRKYKNNALISLDFLPGDRLNISGADTTYKRGVSKGKSYLYPTILIYAAPSGIRNLN